VWFYRHTLLCWQNTVYNICMKNIEIQHQLSIYLFTNTFCIYYYEVEISGWSIACGLSSCLFLPAMHQREFHILSVLRLEWLHMPAYMYTHRPVVLWPKPNWSVRSVGGCGGSRVATKLLLLSRKVEIFNCLHDTL
jgi:hypothetical protein